MRLCSFHDGDVVRIGILFEGRVFTIEEINRELGTTISTSMAALIKNEEVFVLQKILHRDLRLNAGGRSPEDLRYAPPYLDPPKIWGIGLNYVEHATDLKVRPPEEPASFMRPSTTIIGHGDAIALPTQSQRVTAEAELAVIIGRRCKDLSVDEVAAVLPADILSTGTPGAVVIRSGDIVRCEVDGFPALENRVG